MSFNPRIPMRPGGDVPEVGPAEAERLVKEENALIVDVREPYEWAEGHIPGAVHVPLGSLLSRAKELPRDRPLVMQCHLGYRSLQAAMALRQLGFTDVRNLLGGIAAWEQEGLPLTTP